MLCVGGIGSDLGVKPRGIEPFFGDRRIVVEMDQVMRHAWMLRLADKDRLQDPRSFELIGISLVRRRCRSVERQRVMDLSFVVVRIALRQLLHGLRIGLDAGTVIDFFVISVHDCKSVDIVALTLGFSTDALSLPNRGGAVGEILGGRRDVRIKQQAQGNAPIGNAALGIGLQHILKYFL